MDAPHLLEELLQLAATAGLEVRRIRGAAGGEGEPAATSAVCLVRGTPWVVLSASDSHEQRIAVLARALRTHASAYLDSHYLPPAVRARLEP